MGSEKEIGSTHNHLELNLNARLFRMYAIFSVQRFSLLKHVSVKWKNMMVLKQYDEMA